MPVKIVALITPKPGHEAKLDAVIVPLTAGSRAEPGNLRYDIWRVADGRVLIDELYVDHAAVEAHREADHYKAFRAAVGDLVAGPPEVAVAEAINSVA